MNVSLSPDLETRPKLAALARATSKLLATIIGRAAEDMLAEWEVHDGDGPQRGIRLTLTDVDGMGRATFTMADFRDVPKVKERCRALWEQMVEQSSKSEVIPRSRR